jgi:hypothetical protein
MARSNLPEPRTFTLTKAELAAIVAVASNDLARCNLYQIAFYAGGQMSATDGHRLAIYFGAEGPRVVPTDKPIACMDRDAAATVLKAIKARGSVDIVITPRAGGRAPVLTATVRDKLGAPTGVVVSHEDKGHNFPPVGQVVAGKRPDGVGPAGIRLNPTYVAEACATIGATLEKSDYGVEVYTWSDDLSHIQVVGGRFMHMIMPMRPGAMLGPVTAGAPATPKKLKAV